MCLLCEARGMSESVVVSRKTGMLLSGKGIDYISVGGLRLLFISYENKTFEIRLIR